MIERFYWTDHARKRAREREFDREVDIAWIPTAPTERVVREETDWGLVDHDKESGEVTGLEIWDASKKLPRAILERMPEPGRAAAAV